MWLMKNHYLLVLKEYPVRKWKYVTIKTDDVSDERFNSHE